MDIWVKLLLPFALLLGRISAFFAVLPLFSWRALPMRVRAAMALVVTIFFAVITPRPALVDSISPASAENEYQSSAAPGIERSFHKVRYGDLS